MNPALARIALGIALAVTTMTATAHAQTKVIIGSAGANVFRLPMYVALYNGYFKQEGLDADIIETRSGSDAAKMLAGGSLNFVTGPAIDPFNLRRQNFPVSTVALMCNRISNSLVVSKAKANEIKTLADLKGAHDRCDRHRVRDLAVPYADPA